MHKSIIVVMSLVLLLGACGSFMEHSRCDDTLIGRKLSPDGAHSASLYHRYCSTGTTFTYVKLEDTTRFPWLWSGDYEDVVNLVGTYPIDAEWQNKSHLQVKSPGLNQQDPAYLKAVPPKTTWKGIEISYQ